VADDVAYGAEQGTESGAEQDTESGYDLGDASGYEADDDGDGHMRRRRARNEFGPADGFADPALEAQYMRFREGFVDTDPGLHRQMAFQGAVVHGDYGGMVIPNQAPQANPDAQGAEGEETWDDWDYQSPELAGDGSGGEGTGSE
jgi:hypothetical protein